MSGWADDQVTEVPAGATGIAQMPAVLVEPVCDDCALSETGTCGKCLARKRIRAGLPDLQKQTQEDRMERSWYAV